MDQPAGRSEIAEAVPGRVSPSISASSNEVLDPASSELTTPEKSTQNVRTNIAATAVTVLREASVPRQISTAPPAHSPRWASIRSRRDPPKSTSRSIANDPKAANSATTSSSTTYFPSANTTGRTSAVRVALRTTARRR
jgi:hypothetical protein